MAAEPIILEILQEWSRARQLHAGDDMPQMRGLTRGTHELMAAGYQAINADTPTWETLLLEQVHEALAAATPQERRAGLVHVAAVCVRWIEEVPT